MESLVNKYIAGSNLYIYIGTWSKASRLMRDLNARKIVYSNY